MNRAKLKELKDSLIFWFKKNFICRFKGHNESILYVGKAYRKAIIYEREVGIVCSRCADGRYYKVRSIPKHDHALNVIDDIFFPMYQEVIINMDNKEEKYKLSEMYLENIMEK